MGNMIKHAIYAVAAVLLLASCHRTNVTVTGKIKDAGKRKVYLEQLNVDRTVVLDSTESDKDGRFRFKAEVQEPTFFNVTMDGKEFVTVIAQAGDAIEISGAFEGLGKNYWVDGSEHSLWVKLLNFQLNNTLAEMDSLKRSFNALPAGAAHEAQRRQLSASWEAAVRKQIDFSKEFILKHAVSPASYYALYQKFDRNNYILTPEENLHFYKVVASSLKAMYPESQYTRAILKHLEQISKEMQNERIRQLIANTESTLPEVKLPDSKGDTVALSSLKGKYVILDFALLAAKENGTYIPELKKIRKRFGKRLQIYQVCLDDNRMVWERLVKQYGIDWICVRDPEGMKSRTAQQWNVQSIPANYIISPDFEIVGKNLGGDRLMDRLTDLMK